VNTIKHDSSYITKRPEPCQDGAGLLGTRRRSAGRGDGRAGRSASPAARPCARGWSCGRSGARLTLVRVAFRAEAPTVTRSLRWRMAPRRRRRGHGALGRRRTRRPTWWMLLRGGAGGVDSTAGRGSGLGHGGDDVLAEQAQRVSSSAPRTGPWTESTPRSASPPPPGMAWRAGISSCPHCRRHPAHHTSPCRHEIRVAASACRAGRARRPAPCAGAHWWLRGETSCRGRPIATVRCHRCVAPGLVRTGRDDGCPSE
jgi:hypothetical protein